MVAVEDRTHGREGSWAERHGLVGLCPDDEGLARCIRDDVIALNLDTIVDEFIEALLATPETSRILAGRPGRADLKATVRAYLLGFGRDWHTVDYTESRRRIGATHARVGVPLSVYLCAMALLERLLVERIPLGADMRALTLFVVKICALDAAIVSEAYHHARVQRLEASIGELRGEIGIDSLTSVANRRTLLESLDDALEGAFRTSKPLCVLMADLDAFKVVNDTRGHLVGDEVLRDVARRIASALRAGDVVGRYGGDEFLMILRNTPPEVAREIGERVRKHVSATPIAAGGGATVRLTLSVGLTQVTESDDAEAVLTRVDAALYDAKRRGRNRVRSWFRD